LDPLIFVTIMKVVFIIDCKEVGIGTFVTIRKAVFIILYN